MNSYRPDEIAGCLNVNISTVYRLIRDFDDPLPAFRLKANGQLRVHGQSLKQYADNPQDTALQSLVSLLKQYQKELEPSKDLIDYMKRFLDWQIDFYHARGDEATAKAIQREILGEDGLVAYFMNHMTGT